MMTGQGFFGGVEMGGMFSVRKVRKDKPYRNYQDPARYQHPPGSVADECTGALAPASRSQSGGPAAMGGTICPPLRSKCRCVSPRPTRPAAVASIEAVRRTPPHSSPFFSPIT